MQEVIVSKNAVLTFDHGIGPGSMRIIFKKYTFPIDQDSPLENVEAGCMALASLFSGTYTELQTVVTSSVE